MSLPLAGSGPTSTRASKSLIIPGMGVRWGLTLVMLAGGVSFGIGVGVLVRMAAYTSAYDFPDTVTPGIAAGAGLALILIPLIWRTAGRD